MNGICILDWKFDPSTALLGAGDLVAESPALMAKLGQRITEAALEPFNISVAEGMRNAA